MRQQIQKRKEHFGREQDVPAGALFSFFSVMLYSALLSSTLLSHSSVLFFHKACYLTLFNIQTGVYYK